MRLMDLASRKCYAGELIPGLGPRGSPLLFLTPDDPDDPCVTVDRSETAPLLLLDPTLRDVSALDGAGYFLPVHRSRRDSCNPPPR